MGKKMIPGGVFAQGKFSSLACAMEKARGRGSSYRRGGEGLP